MASVVNLPRRFIKMLTPRSGFSASPARFLHVFSFSSTSHSNTSDSYRAPLEYPPQEIVSDKSLLNSNQKITHEVIKRVNEQIANNDQGRLFAVVKFFSQQYKITTEDIIIINHDFVPDIGECVRLDKILLIGSSDFTLLGRPLLDKDLVKIEATVIEKTISRSLLRFHFKKRKDYRRMRFFRDPLTMLRINEISIIRPINESSVLEGMNDRIL